jgi:tRNA-binding protein
MGGATHHVRLMDKANLYEPDRLVGCQVLAVVNFPPRHIASFLSQVLVQGGFYGPDGVVLIEPERPVPNGCCLG